MKTRELAAVAVAESGAAVADTYFSTDLEIAEKSSEIDLVTEADTATQQRMLPLIEDAFPGDAIVAEEADARKTVPETGYAWLIDPIDGTFNYSRELHPWVSSVAVVEDRDPIAAVNVAPVTGERYVSTADRVHCNETDLSVSETADPASFLVASTLRLSTGDHRAFGHLAEAVIERLGEFRRMGSAQLTLSLLASGAFDAVIGFDPDPEPWDTVAGVYQVRQAGGTVTGLHGDRWDIDSPGLVASNGQRHDIVLEVAQETLG